MKTERIAETSTLDEFVAASERLEHWPTMISCLLGSLQRDLASQSAEQEHFLRILRDLHREHLAFAGTIHQWIPQIEQMLDTPFVNTGEIQSVSAHGLCLKIWRGIKTLISIPDPELRGGPEDMQAGDLYFEPEWAARDWNSTQRFLASGINSGDLAFDAESLEYGIRWERSRVVKECGAVMPEQAHEAEGKTASKGKASYNAQMIDKVQDAPESKDWSAQNWADYLDCAKSTVAVQPMWTEIMKQREISKLALKLKQKGE